MEDPLEIDESEHSDEPKKTKSKKRKQKQSKFEDAIVVGLSRKKHNKGIILSVKKPSYALKHGVGRESWSLRREHRTRLQYLLRQLVRRQNWDEACGVLSLLLKGTHKETGLLNNRIKYWTTLKLLEHMEAENLKEKSVKGIYDLWETKDSATTKNKRSVKGRFDVHLEYLLFCLSQGDTDGAKDGVPSLQQDSDFSSDGIANMVAGLVFSHQWYNAIPEDIRSHESPEFSNSVRLRMSGSRGSMLIDHSNGETVVEIQESGSVFKPDSNTSIRMGKKGLMKVDREPKKEISDHKEVHMISESDQGGSFSRFKRFKHTGDKIYGSIVSAHDLEYMLMPMTFPKTKDLELFSFVQKSIHNDHYEPAVKHLQNALHSTPPAFEALLPLIQMLLIGDQVKEAIEEVESVVQNSHAALPFRLKASLLEHFSKEDAKKLSICYEDTLRKDPACSHSLAKLISLHRDGSYSIEKLVEMIGLHLDATYASFDIWKEFASCFLKLSGCDEDRMSTCVNSYKNVRTKFSKGIPDMFQDEVLIKQWKLRCRWWQTRHFTQTILASEVTSGNFELVAYKAASACHLYGPEFAYVVTARKYLKKGKRHEILILKEHMRNAIGFTQHDMRNWTSSNM